VTTLIDHSFLEEENINTYNIEIKSGSTCLFINENEGCTKISYPPGIIIARYAKYTGSKCSFTNYANCP